MKICSNLLETATDHVGRELLRTCNNCEGLYDDSDFEQGRPWWRCGIKPHMENLKGFPFKTPQKCFVLAWYRSIDGDAEGRKIGLKNDTQKLSAAGEAA